MQGKIEMVNRNVYKKKSVFKYYKIWMDGMVNNNKKNKIYLFIKGKIKEIRKI